MSFISGGTTFYDEFAFFSESNVGNAQQVLNDVIQILAGGFDMELGHGSLECINVEILAPKRLGVHQSNLNLL